MAIERRVICDRCKASYILLDGEKPKLNSRIGYHPNIEMKKEESKFYDLCARCDQAFKVFMTTGLCEGVKFNPTDIDECNKILNDIF